MFADNKSSSEEQTVLVTGATGFIGSRLTKKLFETGHKVKTFSRADYPGCTQTEISIENWITGEFSDEQGLAYACQNVDVAFHSAGIAHADGQNDKEYMESNFLATQRLFAACLRAGVGTFVYFSSIIASYSSNTAYARSKRAAEDFLLSQNSLKSSIQVIILRPANVYGVGMRGNMRTFVLLSKRGILPALPIIEASFPLVSVEDLCRVAISVAHDEPRSDSSPIYLVTDGQLYTPNKLEELVYLALDKRIPKIRLPKFLVFVGALLAHALNSLGLYKNSLGLPLYKNLFTSRPTSDSNMPPLYEYIPTASLETEMLKIVGSMTEE